MGDDLNLMEGSRGKIMIRQREGKRKTKRERQRQRERKRERLKKPLLIYICVYACEKVFHRNMLTKIRVVSNADQC